MRSTMLLVAVALSCGAASAGEVGFSTKPAAAKDGDKVKIAFTVSAPTDVEVAVLDLAGKVIRHLVAGVLGAKDAPPDPLKAGLGQSMEWDGLDDAGKPAGSGPFKIRVRAGMKPELDGFMLDSPPATGAISSVAVGPGGSVYLFHHDRGESCMHWGGTQIKVLTRDGKHQQTVKPFPADIPPEKLKPLGAMVNGEGDLVPRIHHQLRRSFYPAAGWQMPGQCPVVDRRGRVYWLAAGPALAALDADGGVPYESLAGPRLLPELKGLTMADYYALGASRPCLALSSDEKFLYFAGLTAGNFYDQKKMPIKGVPCVFRVPLDTRGPAEVFLGKLDSPGGEKDLLTAPRGLAVAGGLVYVADCDADRVAVFSEQDRTLVGEIKTKAPDSLGVDPAGGAVYVCSVAKKTVPDLIKFDGYKTGKELLRLPLPAYKYANENGVPHRIAVDCSARPVRIWVPSIEYSGRQLTCIEDAGDKFVDKGDPRAVSGSSGGGSDLSYDPVRGELYVRNGGQRWLRIEERTGKIIAEIAPAEIRPGRLGSQLVAGPDGDLYTYSWSRGEGGLRLFDRDGKPKNWLGLTSNHIPIPGIMNHVQRSLIVRSAGELYLIPPSSWRTDDGGGTGNGTTSLNVFGMDGKVKRTLVWQCTAGAILRMDPKGNIYLAEMVKPPDRSCPEFFDGKVKPPPPQTNAQNDSYYYSYMYGSIVKFPPTGGALWYGKVLSPGVEGQPPAELLAKPKVPVAVHLGFETHAKAELQGALWYRFGFAPYTCTLSSCTLTCMCEGGGFDVDPYGRVFFPNLGQFRVEVLDTNGNPLTAFGQYGNQDSGGKDARVKKPEIPLAWPLTVAVSETHAYVADVLGGRLAKVKLGWAAEETCPVGP